MAECYEQASLEISGSIEDPAVVSTVEEPSVSKMTGSLGVSQRTETGYQERNNVPRILDKAHVISEDSGLLKTGDSGREQGGTQEFLSEFTHS
ncbi:MAG: hypothetical protein ACFFE7_16255 [Candidatus Thorarchaeota archaeon]